MGQALAEVVFWAALGSLVYVYFGLPLLVGLVGRLWPRPVASAPYTPSVSLIIAAYNEEEAIGERLDNALTLDYPPDCLEIIVASDGSTDRTEEIVSERDVRLLRLPRRGKIPALNEAVRHARGEILVFSDANTIFDAGALRSLMRNFADPSVGGVAGHTGYKLGSDDESSSRGESLYWRYDTWLKEMESRSGSVVSAHGGLYALRRELYEPSQDPAVTDDFFISTGVVARGYRLVFERDARAYEFAVPVAAREFRRRIRLMTRGLRSLFLRRQLLNPFRYGFYAAVLFSHKLLRRLLPLSLIALLGVSLYLAAGDPFYRLAAIGQLAFYGLAALGLAVRGSGMGQSKLLYVPFFFCMANLASLVALVRFLRGERISRWQPQRHAVPETGR